MNYLSILFLSITLLFSLSGHAQNLSEIEKALTEVGITQNDLNHIADGTEAIKKYTYKVTSEERNSLAENTIKVMRFDPRKAVGEQWELLTVNGKAPTNIEIEAFNKEKNDEDDHIEEQEDDLVREEDIWIESKDDKTLVIGFKFNKKKLHHSQKIMKHFHARLTIDKVTKTIADVELYSFEPFTMLLVMKVQEMTIKLGFKQMPNGDELLEYSKATINLKILGQEGIGTVNQTYSEYEKVL
jgi:hypothetical protein